MRLYLDDVRNPPEDGGGPWTICRTAEEARAVLLAGPVDEATLDHDLGECDDCTEARGYQTAFTTCSHRMTGYDLVKWMAERAIWPKTKPRVHSANPAGAANMRATIDRYFTAERAIWPKTKPRVHSANPAGAANMRATIDRYFTAERP